MTVLQSLIPSVFAIKHKQSQALLALIIYKMSWCVEWFFFLFFFLGSYKLRESLWETLVSQPGEENKIETSNQ